MGELGAPIPDPLPLGPSLYALVGQVSTFGLSQITTFISGSHMLTHTTQSEPPTALVLAVATSSHDSVAIPIGMRDTLVPRASYPTVTSDACLGRIPVAEHRVESCHTAVSLDDMAISTATCTTSCRTPTACVTGAGACLDKLDNQTWTLFGSRTYSKPEKCLPSVPQNPQRPVHAVLGVLYCARLDG